MPRMLDLEPAARQVMILVDGVSDDQLTAATPCEAYTVGDLLDHFMSLTMEFTRAATKATMTASRPEGAPTGAPKPSAANLHRDWRTRLPQQLDELAVVWKDPAAWEGTTRAGGVTMPAETMGLVAIDELVLHGWDLARGTGQTFEVDPASAQAVFEFTSMSAAPGEEAAREGLFGPVVEVPDDAPLFDRALGLSGRDPAWSAG